MDNEGLIKLDYIEEFRIACKINHLQKEEVIQFFVDHVSFYAFIGGKMDDIYHCATTVCVEFKELWRRTAETVKDPVIQQLSLKYIRLLTALSLETNLSIQDEMDQSISLMKEWAAEMLPLTDYQSHIFTESGESFELTFDFNLLCRMNGIDMQLLLQYFVDSVSLARERAINIFEWVNTEACTAVLLLLSVRYTKLKEEILPQQEIYRQFGLRLLKLDRKQKEEKELDQRINHYKVFYRQWYKALNAQNNSHLLSM